MIIDGIIKEIPNCALKDNEYALAAPSKGSVYFDLWEYDPDDKKWNDQVIESSDQLRKYLEMLIVLAKSTSKYHEQAKNAVVALAEQYIDNICL